MSMARHEWDIGLTLLAPFATTGVENVGLGIDKAFLRNERGEIILSGHQVRGLFRHFLMEVIGRENEAGIDDRNRLVRVEWFFNWFGRPGRQYGSEEGDLKIYSRLGASEKQANAAGDDLGRGRLTIRDLVLSDRASEKGGETTNRTRIRVDRERKSVRPGALLVREQMHKTGEKADFECKNGVILYGSDAEKKAFGDAFAIFLENLPEIGAMKSAGYGRVEDGRLNGYKGERLTIPDDGPDGETFAIAMTFSHPLLVEPHLASGNVQESANHISGAVIKAAIAEFGQLAMGKDKFDKEFGSALSKMIIRIALPVKRNSSASRPRALPFSLVKDRSEFKDFFDPGTSGAIKFEVDFKGDEYEAALAACGQHNVSWVSQTRTAIEPGTQHAAENQLFNYRMAGVRDTEWRGEIILPADLSEGEKAKAQRLMALLKSELIQIGKTRADMTARVVSGKDPCVRADADGVWRLTLQSPACLFDLACMEKLRTGAVTLRDAYIGYFETVFEDAQNSVDWESFDFLARHRLFGGHRAAYTRKKRSDPYYPFLLSETGSVFRFPLKDGQGAAKLKERLEQLVCRGLKSFDDDWQLNPFVPENGYGEVRIDGEDRQLPGKVRWPDD